MTTSSQKILPLAAWSFLLSQKPDFSNNHLAGVPITPNHEETMEMRDKVLSSVKAQDMDTSGHQLSDLHYDDFYWNIDQLDVDAILRPGIDTPFSPTAFDVLQMGGGSAENRNLHDEEEDKENSPPPRTTPVSERPTRPPALLRSCPFETRIENVPDFVYRILFQ